MVEEIVFLFFFTYADNIIHISFPAEVDKREITLSLDMKKVCSREFSINVWCIHSVNFLFMISSMNGAGILKKKALTSRYTKVSDGATFCSFRDLANALLSLTNKKLLPQ